MKKNFLNLIKKLGGKSDSINKKPPKLIKKQGRKPIICILYNILYNVL